jgi:hypothetical protein
VQIVGVRVLLEHIGLLHGLRVEKNKKTKESGGSADLKRQCKTVDKDEEQVQGKESGIVKVGVFDQD